MVAAQLYDIILRTNRVWNNVRSPSLLAMARSEHVRLSVNSCIGYRIHGLLDAGPDHLSSLGI